MKKLIKSLFILIILLLATTNVFASTNTRDRKELDNLGVNKDIEINDNNRSIIMKTKSVDASEKIYDFSELLTEEEEKILKRRIDDFVEKNHMDLVILTDNFSYTEDDDNGFYAADFYDYNDFGMSFKHDSGIVFLRNTYEPNPFFNMYTFGDAILYFPNEKRIDKILDSIYDDIHLENYLKGLEDFIDKVEDSLQSGKPKESKNKSIDENGKIQTKYVVPWMICIGVASAITFIVMIILIKKNKMIVKARKAEAYLDKQSVQITNRKDIFISTHTSSYKISSDSGGGGFSSHTGSSGRSFGGGSGRHG